MSIGTWASLLGAGLMVAIVLALWGISIVLKNYDEDR